MVLAMDTLTLSFSVVLTACFLLQVVYGQGAELEIISFEKDNLTIRFNQSATEMQNDDYYVIEVRTRLSDGGAEYEGRVVRWNNTCTVTYQKSLRCVTKMGPVELYRKINKSHVETEWTWTWKDNNSGKLKTNQSKKKLSGMHYFNSEMTLMEFITTEIILATSINNLFPVAPLLRYLLAVIGGALILAYAIKKGWKKVSKDSEGDSKEHCEETLAKNEPRESVVGPSERVSSNTDEFETSQKHTAKEEKKPPSKYKYAGKELRCLLVGKTGGGKSSTGNTILGTDLFHTSPGFSSETTECQTHGGDVGKWKVEITDSPGLFNTSLTEDNIAVMIKQAIACLHPGPSAFLFVMRISSFTQEEEATYRRLKEIFDEDVTKHMVIVFTGGDCLSDKGTNIGNMLKAAPSGLKQILNACEERYVVFDNSATGKTVQVKRLLKTVEKMIK